MPHEPFFIFNGNTGDLVKVHYADKVYENLGILLEKCVEQPNKWMVVIGGSIHRLHQDRLEVISEKSS